ncbi:uncharacterized protein [Lepisosteus oculatus]|uniref:uncharacterized protein n=1 Tax=Lepisosteus oculatus TaxID=7918 RepID=UPI003712D93C
MSIAGIHRGFLKKYGGFLFKQWKERFLFLTVDGSLLVCRDEDSPPDLVVALHGGCEAIVEGKEILDLPRLPAGGQRDCCLALLLPEDKYLLLLAASPQECSQWLNILRKVKESTSSPRSPLYSCKRHMTSPPQLSDRGALGQAASQKEQGSVSPRAVSGGTSPRSARCLRHGSGVESRRAVRAVCLLMGGAAASSALGYLGSCNPPATTAAGHTPEIQPPAELRELGYHPAVLSPDPEASHFTTFEFEGDQDFDAFDCGGFAF